MVLRPDAVTVIGAGLAGTEAAWQLARRGIPVVLVEMRPSTMTPAHHGADFAELVCSNSLKSEDPDTAAGLLKHELEALGSVVLATAYATRVPAGAALAVDRARFSAQLTSLIAEQPLIQVMSPRGNCDPGRSRLSLRLVLSQVLRSKARSPHLSETTGCRSTMPRRRSWTRRRSIARWSSPRLATAKGEEQTTSTHP